MNLNYIIEAAFLYINIDTATCLGMGASMPSRRFGAYSVPIGAHSRDVCALFQPQGVCIDRSKIPNGYRSVLPVYWAILVTADFIEVRKSSFKFLSNPKQKKKLCDQKKAAKKNFPEIRSRSLDLNAIQWRL
jgi:hypothetical protein